MLMLQLYMHWILEFILGQRILRRIILINQQYMIITM